MWEQPGEGGGVSVHNTCVYIRRQSMGSIVPAPIAPVQVESRQVYVNPWWEAGRAGQDWARGVCQPCGILNERGHTGSGPFLPGCRQGVAPADEREWALLVNWRTGRRVTQVGTEVR